jgi:hypothetical protein
MFTTALHPVTEAIPGIRAVSSDTTDTTINPLSASPLPEFISARDPIGSAQRFFQSCTLSPWMAPHLTIGFEGPGRLLIRWQTDSGSFFCHSTTADGDDPERTRQGIGFTATREDLREILIRTRLEEVLGMAPEAVGLPILVRALNER